MWQKHGTRRQATVTDKSSARPEENPTEALIVETGGVFISHVHEDAPLAQAFAQLVWDVTSAGVRTFSSTSTDLGAGIQYGEEWFKWIRASVERARQIVALITPNSVGRPWILFEAGLGKARQDAAVFGLCLGISREDAYKGPFAVLQNCGTGDKEMMKLCREMMQGTLLNPRDKEIELHVQEFRASVDSFFATQEQDGSENDDPTGTVVFQALEEMKLMLRAQSRPSEGARPSPGDIVDVDGLMQTLHYYPLTSSLRLQLVASYAAQSGILWIQPLVEYVTKSPVRSLQSRIKVVHGLLEDLCHRSGFRGNYDLIMCIHHMLDEHLDQRRSTAEEEFLRERERSLSR
jgi:hypothetical protein